MESNGIVFILSAPSGTGKTTICRLLKQRLPELKFSVSHTTREIRNGETEGIDYHFIPQKDFEKKIERHEFLEWAIIHEQYYGTAGKTRAVMGEHCVIEISGKVVRSTLLNFVPLMAKMPKRHQILKERFMCNFLHKLMTLVMLMNIFRIISPAKNS